MITTCLNPNCLLPGKAFATERSARRYCSSTCANQDRQRRLLSSVPEINVLSCGGGVQSTAIVGLIYAGTLPRPDLLVMVDTGYEKRGTLEYVDTILRRACAKMAIEFVMLRTPNNDSVFSQSGVLLIPAYKVLPDGTVQKLPTRCSGPWKAEVIRRYLRSRGVAKARMWLGISTDEADRQRVSKQGWVTNYYPLLDLNISRYQCLYTIRSLGWPDPARSSCIFCPNQKDDEYELLKSEYPVDYQRVVVIDNDIERRDPSLFLHRSLTRMRDIIWRCDVAGHLAAMPPVPCEICQ